jgi:hypothetical protein
MLVNEIILAFPLLTSVLGEKWLRQNLWYEEFISLRLEWYDQLERNLRTLDSRVRLQSLRKCYGSMLRDRKSILTTLSMQKQSSTELSSTSNVRPERMTFLSTCRQYWKVPKEYRYIRVLDRRLTLMMRQTWVWVLITRKTILRSKQLRQVQKCGRSCPKVSHNFRLGDAI